MIIPLASTNRNCKKVGEGHHWWAVVDDEGHATVSRWLEVNCDDEWFIEVTDRAQAVPLRIIAVVFNSLVDRDVAVLRF